ncbi:MAG: rpoD, partial [Modestobacter sp.]|nr:rpoD [Modestobacter sp.]
MPADQPGPEAAAVSSPSSRRTVAARSATSSPSTAPVTKAPTAKKAPAKKAPAAAAKKASGARKPSISPSPGTGEGTVLTAVATDGSAVAVVDAGSQGLKLDETVVTGKDGVAVADATDGDKAEGEGPEFEWDDEEESEALRQARKDAELTASADSVRAYLKQIGKVALLTAEEEVDLAKRIEAGLYGAERLRQ